MQQDDFLAIQDKWQARWRQDKTFEVDINPDKEKFFITVPYPYISGSLHIGHARVVIEADVYSRFLRMRGRNVLFPIAFHISGTPVLGISLAIAEGDQDKIALYKSYVANYIQDPAEQDRIVASFKDPQKIVDFFIPKMQDEFSRLGLGVDWRRSFTSGDILHQALVDWQFRKYKEKGFLVQGKYPVLYSLSLQSAVGEDDIAQGDTDAVDKVEFTLLKFPYEDGFLVAASLRPETMYGQTNMWANPDLPYLKAKVDGEIWYISKECAEKLRYQDHTVEELATIPGKDFMGKICKAPVVDQELLILPSLHCDPDIGTGFVTSVPSDAPYDWVMLKDLQDHPDKLAPYDIDPAAVKALEPIPIIDSKGYGDLPALRIVEQQHISPKDKKRLDQATQEIYKVGFHTGIMKPYCGPYAGMKASEAKEAMKQDLIKQGDAQPFYETSRKATSRDGGKIIVSLLENQWFLDFNADDWKAAAHKVLDQMSIVPEKYRKQFEDVFAWLDKRPCARRRGLGTKLPFDQEWVIESLSDSTLYVSLYPFAHLAKTLTRDQLSSHFFDYVYLDKGHAGSVSDTTGIGQEQLEQIKQSFSYWYPNDHRHTFTAHLANHLSFLIFAHAGLMPPRYWPKKFSFHGMVISGGEKMSKSKGNVVTLLDVIGKYGSDAFRSFMCNTTSIDSTINWQEQEVLRLQKHLFSLITTLRSLKPGSAAEPSNKAFVSKFHRSIQEATKALEDMNLRQYSMIVLYQIANDYKKELQRLEPAAQEALGAYVRNDWIRLLTPLIPHYAEELWEAAGGEGLVSLASWPRYDPQKILPAEEYKELLLDNLLADIRTVQQLAKLDKLTHITIITPAHWKYDLFKLLKQALAETHNTGELIKRVMQSGLKDKHPKLAQLVPRWTDKVPPILLPAEAEHQLIQDQAAYLGKTFGCEVRIVAETATDLPKASQALPAKPAIVVA